MCMFRQPATHTVKPTRRRIGRRMRFHDGHRLSERSAMVIRASAAVLAGLFLRAAGPGGAIAQGSADSTAASLTPPAVVPASTPPDFPRGRISGYMFGDAYYNADGDPTHVYSAGGADAGQTNIDGVKNITKDLNGAQFRRIYFQLDNDLSVPVATPFRLASDGRITTTAARRLGSVAQNSLIHSKSVLHLV